jgi:hypothetical protein
MCVVVAAVRESFHVSCLRFRTDLGMILRSIQWVFASFILPISRSLAHDVYPYAGSECLYFFSCLPFYPSCPLLCRPWVLLSPLKFYCCTHLRALVRSPLVSPISYESLRLLSNYLRST